MLDPVAEEARPAFRVADCHEHLAVLGTHDRRRQDQAERQHQRRGSEQGGARAVSLDVEAEDVLEVGEAVVAAEAHVVAEERKQQRVGHRLSDDREIDAVDPRAEGEPAEDEGEQPRDKYHHERGKPEHVEAMPEPRQLLPVEEHHEIRQQRVTIGAARPDLAHQVHAHGVTAEREESRMPERKDAAETPDEIERQRQQRIGQVLAEQRHKIGRHVQWMIGRGQKVERRDKHGEADKDRNGDQNAAVERPHQK